MVIFHSYVKLPGANPKPPRQTGLCFLANKKNGSQNMTVGPGRTGTCKITVLVWCQIWTLHNFTGWWFQPLWKIVVNWDDHSQYGKTKVMFQTTNQFTISDLSSAVEISISLFGHLDHVGNVLIQLLLPLASKEWDGGTPGPLEKIIGLV